jgi:hypothetical protein
VAMSVEDRVVYRQPLIIKTLQKILIMDKSPFIGQLDRYFNVELIETRNTGEMDATESL